MIATSDLEQKDQDWRLERAIGLFEFLTQAQLLRSVPVRSVEAYQREGNVIWLADLPQHFGVERDIDEDPPALDTPVMTLHRVPPVDPPEPPHGVAGWLDGPIGDPAVEPGLLEQVHNVDGTTDELADRPEVSQSYRGWIEAWRSWAGPERLAVLVRRTYKDLFAMRVNVEAQPEQFELVLGVGCLAWGNPSGERVLRHMLVAPVSIRFDEESGDLVVAARPSADGLAVELDMLDPALITDPDRINAIKNEAREYPAHPLDRDGVGHLATRLVHTLDARGQYADAIDRPEPAPDALCAFAPALILRRRSQRGLVETYQAIVAQLRETGVIPDGILPLVDPDHVPVSPSDSEPGAAVEIDDELFLPMPVNDQQLDVIHSVDANAQTVVQGPPGTGKTHTAAALITHLLARGKRVLITAQTDRALREVRAKLPAEIQPLCVSVIGASRDDMASLKVAVETIADHAADFDHDASDREIQAALGQIDELRRARALAHRRMLDARQQETSSQSFGAYDGTLARIAEKYDQERDRFGWLAEFVSVPAGCAAPLTDSEASEWLSLLRDQELTADDQESQMRLLDVDSLVSCIRSRLPVAVIQIFDPQGGGGSR
jgi:hypothetical protein